MKIYSLTRKFSSKVAATQNVVACASMFGIGVDEDIDITLYERLEVRLGPGRLIYITGDSGAGKSCLLADLHEKCKDDFNAVTSLNIGNNAVPLVDQFDGLGLKETLELLNYVGIADAWVYLRAPMQLSDGQRYRFGLAKAIHAAMQSKDRTSVVFMDEFLAVLDRQVAKVVAYKTRQIAKRHGIAFVVATTHSDIENDLQPNTTITLRLNETPKLTQRMG